MANDKILTFVLTSQAANEFIADFHEQSNFIDGTNAILIAKAKLFVYLLQEYDADFEFRMVIHEGIANRGGYSRSESMISELERDLPSFRKNKLVFLTRQQELFPNQESKIVNSTGIHLNFNKSNYEGIVEELIIYRKKDFTGEIGIAHAMVEDRPPVAKIDFAILTALYDHEHAVFRSRCQLGEATGLLNSNYAVFKDKKSLLHGPDYEGQFILANQRKMGLVDAAIHATQAITLKTPAFLIMPGVCGGRKGVVNQYDIIIPAVVHDYATGRFKEGKLESLGYESPINTELKEFLEKHRKRIIDNMRQLIDEDRSDLLSPQFEIHIGHFAAGPWVVKTEGALTKMATGEAKRFSKKAADTAFANSLPVSVINRDIKGLEMESYSVIRAGEILQKPPHYSLVVKSVMDFTNELKNDGEFKEIKSSAAYISYLCVRAMMPILLEFEKTVAK